MFVKKKKKDFPDIMDESRIESYLFVKVQNPTARYLFIRRVKIRLT